MQAAQQPYPAASQQLVIPLQSGPDPGYKGCCPIQACGTSLCPLEKMANKLFSDIKEPAKAKAQTESAQQFQNTQGASHPEAAYAQAAPSAKAATNTAAAAYHSTQKQTAQNNPPMYVQERGASLVSRQTYEMKKVEGKWVAQEIHAKNTEHKSAPQASYASSSRVSDVARAVEGASRQYAPKEQAAAQQTASLKADSTQRYQSTKQAPVQQRYQGHSQLASVAAQHTIQASIQPTARTSPISSEKAVTQQYANHTATAQPIVRKHTASSAASIPTLDTLVSNRGPKGQEVISAAQTQATQPARAQEIRYVERKTDGINRMDTAQVQQSQEIRYAPKASGVESLREQKLSAHQSQGRQVTLETRIDVRMQSSARANASQELTYQITAASHAMRAREEGPSQRTQPLDAAIHAQGHEDQKRKGTHALYTKKEADTASSQISSASYASTYVKKSPEHSYHAPLSREQVRGTNGRAKERQGAHIPFVEHAMTQSPEPQERRIRQEKFKVLSTTAKAASTQKTSSKKAHARKQPQARRIRRIVPSRLSAGLESIQQAA